jgi:membrane protein
VKARLQRIVDFIRHDVWELRPADLPKVWSFGIRQLRVILLTVRGFAADQCSLRAHVLTFYSALALVPAVALAFGIARGFGLRSVLEQQVMAMFKGQEEVAATIVEYAGGLLDKVEGEVIAGVGVAIVLWTVVEVLRNVEKSFNGIWGVGKGRTLGRKFTDYLAVAVIAPLFLAGTGSATAFLVHAGLRLDSGMPNVVPVGPVVTLLVRLSGLAAAWALFTFIYAFMPNVKVRLKSALMAGIVAGTAYLVVQRLFVALQLGVTKYSAIYGSFAFVPLFLLWMNLSWVIVLFGAELSFAHQNVDTYEFEPEDHTASAAVRRLVALGAVRLVAMRFMRGDPALLGPEIAHEMGAPMRLTNEVLCSLSQADVLSEVRTSDGKEAGYQPARNPQLLTAAYVLESLEHLGADEVHIAESEDLGKLTSCLEQLREAVRSSPANVPVTDL